MKAGRLLFNQDHLCAWPEGRKQEEKEKRLID